jgi:long-subunit fatty acid transport protein
MKHLIVGLVLLFGTAVAACASGHPYTELEIPVPELTGTHARALGMGGAHIAVAEDASALTWNPAGLANIRRIEISASLGRGDRSVETVWHGTSADWGEVGNQLGGLHFLYPFPAYRGSLVLGIGVDRLQDYALHYKRSGVDPDVSFFGGGPGLLTDTHERDGKLSGYSAAIAWDAGPRLSFGGTLTYLRGSMYDEQTFFTEDVYAQDASYVSFEDYYLLDAKISGFTATAGFLYKASPRVRFGGVLGAPRYLSFDRYELYRTRDRFENGTEEITYEEIPIYDDEEITFPYWIGFGVSVAAPGAIVAADIRHTDWREIKDEIGSRRVLLRPYYRDGTSFSIGAEGILPFAPLRVRAGYRYDPAPFNLTYIPFDGEDVIDVGRDPAEIDIAIDRERQFLSFGAGYLFDRVLAIDVAYQMGRLERVSKDPSRAPYREERSSDELILSVGYRF